MIIHTSKRLQIVYMHEYSICTNQIQSIFSKLAFFDSDE